MSHLQNLQKLNKTVESVENRVCDVYKIPRSVFRNRARSKVSTQARFASWYILYHVHGLSYPTIGEIYGYDHTTVLYGVSRARELKIPEEMGV